MHYSAKAIANHFLDLARRDRKELSSLKLQRLVFLAHEWSKAMGGGPLISNRIENGFWGPGISELQDEFKKFGVGPIKRRAFEWYAKNGRAGVVEPQIDSYPDSKKNESTKALLNRVWELYGNLGVSQLSQMADPDSATWEKKRRELRASGNTNVSYSPKT